MSTDKHYMWHLAGAEDIYYYWFSAPIYYVPDDHIRYEGSKRITTSGCDYLYRFLDTMHITRGQAVYVY